MVKPGAREQEFVKSLNHYLSKMNYGKSKPGELNEEEFVKFWADLYDLFVKDELRQIKARRAQRRGVCQILGRSLRSF